MWFIPTNKSVQSTIRRKPVVMSFNIQTTNANDVRRYFRWQIVIIHRCKIHLFVCLNEWFLFQLQKPIEILVKCSVRIKFVCLLLWFWGKQKCFVQFIEWFVIDKMKLKLHRILSQNGNEHIALCDVFICTGKWLKITKCVHLTSEMETTILSLLSLSHRDVIYRQWFNVFANICSTFWRLSTQKHTHTQAERRRHTFGGFWNSKIELISFDCIELFFEHENKIKIGNICLTTFGLFFFLFVVE